LKTQLKSRKSWKEDFMNSLSTIGKRCLALNVLVGGVPVAGVMVGCRARATVGSGCIGEE
jgi:hypothetical protein